jgi:DNA-binding NarL/FixJ family response regulator
LDSLEEQRAEQERQQTDRERHREIANLVQFGLSGEQIAAALTISLEAEKTRSASDNG